jgi:cell division protein FtsW
VRKLISKIEGDKIIWLIALLLSVLSAITVYSASSNLGFNKGDGNILGMLGNHVFYLGSGFALMFLVHRLEYPTLGAIAKILLVPIIFLLAYTLVNGVNVGNASRWITIPFTDRTFQPSALAAVVLFTYIARYLAISSYEKLDDFMAHFWGLVIPIFLVTGLILPANFSTASLVFGVSLMILFVGHYPLKNLFKIGGIALGGFTLFLLLVFAFPNINNRVATWKSRIESFSSGSQEENYQVTRAKMAIAEGYLTGKGPGKSNLKNFLPQSNSDFIYAVLVEELGTVTGIVTIFLYCLLLMRVLSIAKNAASPFGSLLVSGLGFSLLAQAFVNLSVAVNLIPVTGQTLPLVSAGGTSIWMTCLALGMILSVSRGKNQVTEEKPTEMEALESNNLSHA